MKRLEPGLAGARGAARGRLAFPEDLRMAREALAGSLEAREAFVERMACVPRFLAVKNGRLGRPLGDDELRDLTQETLVTIWRRLDSYEGLASLQTWAYRFCHFVTVSHLKSTSRRTGLVAFDDEAFGRDEERSDRYEHVYAALERVDEQDALVVRYRHFEHMSFQEICQAVSSPVSSVKARYYRGLARLKELLGPLHKEAGL